MFGTNPVRHLENRTDGMFRVQEIFRTIQGEGPFVGTPAIFIRLAGCNLRCHFCDTDFESNYENLMSVFDIQKRVETLAGHGIRLVVVTGGEPLLQRVDNLVVTMPGYHFQIETAGTVNPFNGFILSDLCVSKLSERPVPGRMSIVISPKTPVLNKQIANWAHSYKYIVSINANIDRDDGLPVDNTQQLEEGVSMYPLAKPPPGFPRNRIFIQPCDDLNKPENTKLAIDVCLEYGYRLSLQTHKLIGLP